MHPRHPTNPGLNQQLFAELNNRYPHDDIFFITPFKTLIALAETSPSYPSGHVEKILRELNTAIIDLFELEKTAQFVPDMLDLNHPIRYVCYLCRKNDASARFFRGIGIHLDLLRDPNDIAKHAKTLDDIRINIARLGDLDHAEIELSKSHLDDFLTIARLLYNDETLMTGLQQLEIQLRQHAQDMKANVTEIKPGMIKLGGESKTKKQKLLSSFLYQWARENGFNPDQYAKATGNISSHHLARLFASKTLFKQSKADRDVGPFAFFLLCYVATEANKKSPCLTHTVPELVASIASPAYNKNNKLSLTRIFFPTEYIGRLISNDTLALDRERLPLLSDCYRRYQSQYMLPWVTGSVLFKPYQQAERAETPVVPQEADKKSACKV